MNRELLIKTAATILRGEPLHNTCDINTAIDKAEELIKEVYSRHPVDEVFDADLERIFKEPSEKTQDDSTLFGKSQKMTFQEAVKYSRESQKYVRRLADGTEDPIFEVLVNASNGYLYDGNGDHYLLEYEDTIATDWVPVD